MTGDDSPRPPSSWLRTTMQSGRRCSPGLASRSRQKGVYGQSSRSRRDAIRRRRRLARRWPSTGEAVATSFPRVHLDVDRAARGPSAPTSAPTMVSIFSWRVVRAQPRRALWEQRACVVQVLARVQRGKALRAVAAHGAIGGALRSPDRWSCCMTSRSRTPHWHRRPWVYVAMSLWAAPEANRAPV